MGQGKFFISNEMFEFEAIEMIFALMFIRQGNKFSLTPRSPEKTNRKLKQMRV